MSDLISRQAAIDAILHNQEVYSNNFGNDPIDKYTIAIIDNDAQTVAQLPSAQPERCEDCVNFSKTRLLIPQPEIIRCKDCRHWKKSYTLPPRCEAHEWFSKKNDYCSFAERRSE